ncbi:Ran GAP Rna1 [Coniosporium apollinis]|uniref:Ran GAP Rna1 n=1 Tax=Coniosporium apollinis TaxID=61459 RepID=A0ABQ9P3Z2_9PEZI|nr:Ran GAP Rna1 [Coniosporium apollinis]
MASSKVFSLEGKGLKLDTAADIEPHIKELVDNPDVEEVRFQGNTLGVEASEALAKVLETKKKLQTANLADIFTSRLLSEIPPALDALLKALLTLPSLHTINLSDNAFGLNTQAPLVSFLSAHVPLRHLILNNNGLGPAAGTLVANALSELAEKKAAARKEGGDGSNDVPDLETVICGRNRLENGSMAAWAKAFAAHTGVREVKMVQNGIRQEGITLLLKEGLRHAAGLRTLDLQDNTFTAMGARALSDVVGGWTELVELGIGDSLLSARGGVMLATALGEGKNQALEVLRLQFNDIDAKGVKGVADALEKMPKLRRVELNGNKFSEEDVAVDRLREVLSERKENSGEDADAADEDYWGLDELDELEDEDEDEEEDVVDEEEGEEEEDADVDKKAEKGLERVEQAEDEKVALENDKEVDQLADLLDKTDLK